jgi:hypothetical protein
MAITIRIPANTVVSMNSLSAIPVGTGVEIQNVSVTPVKVQGSLTEPSMDDYKLLTRRGTSGATLLSGEGSLEVWMMSTSEAVVAVEEL